MKELDNHLRLRMEELKVARKKPNGDFFKVRVTNSLLGVANLRNLLRQEDVKKLHPVPGDAAQLWVCEQNVHPIGSWVLNYSKVADEELGEEIRRR